MAPGAPGARPAELEDFVEAYESVRARDAGADLSAFLPARGHPLYMTVLCELVRIDLEYAWRGGRPRRLEEYEARFPELFRDRERVQEVAFEEYRLRRQLGDVPDAGEYERRWGVNAGHWPGGEAPGGSGRDGRPPSWETDPSPGGAPAGTPYPEPGDAFLDFQLLAELGRGAFGRVYLARQKGLFGRYVVLKVATNISLEARILVQLQHTNIVPVYSVHQAGPLHALCMPFLGATTLADVLKDLRGRQSLPQSGKGLVDTATACLSATRQGFADRGVPAGAGAAGGTEGAAGAAKVYWTHLERLTFVQAVLWLGVRLADGLAHAHDRGILHRDLKPANVLLTEEGQPMLLDFNLSEDVKLSPGSAAAFVGGTLPYMSPERLRAFRRGGPAAGASGDVYSLGVIFYELLTGRQPFPVRTGAVEGVVDEMVRDRGGPPPRLRGWNRAVSPAVESIVRHCLEPDPARRFQSARELQEDLQRHLENRPLRHAVEASRGERTAKWARRHPRLALAAAACSALALIAGLVAWLAVGSARQARWEAIALAGQFRDEARQARVLLVTSPLSDRERVAEGTSLAFRALDRYRVREDPKWWDAPAVRRLPPADRETLREEAGDLALLLASVTALQARAAGDAGGADGLRAALLLNRASESCYADGSAPVLLRRQREGLNRLLDGRDATPREEVRPAADGLQSAKDLCMNATELAERSRFAEALPLWRRAARQSPMDLWPWSGLAACYENLARYEDAAACYGTSIALAPDQDWLYFKRGVVYLRAQNYEEARADFDRFLARRPDVPEGYINRAVAREGLREYGPAIGDVTKAIELGTSQTRAYFIRALLRERTGDREGARRDKQTGSEREPADELSCVVRGLERLEADPKGALADFDRALRFNPRSLDGMQNRASVLSEKLGRTPEAVAVLDREIELYPGFVPARAGRGVLLARLGKRKEALRDAEECLRRDTRPATVYQVAGIYALTSRQQPEDRQEALFLLSSALRKGYGKDLVGIDTDLDPIRAHPDFRRLLARTGAASGTQ
jgi:serine/threonine protein kinase/tetratricopeptide (TPR) repeat protein